MVDSQVPRVFVYNITGMRGDVYPGPKLKKGEDLPDGIKEHWLDRVRNVEIHIAQFGWLETVVTRMGRTADRCLTISGHLVLELPTHQFTALVTRDDCNWLGVDWQGNMLTGHNIANEMGMSNQTVSIQQFDSLPPIHVPDYGANKAL